MVANVCSSVCTCECTKDAGACQHGSFLTSLRSNKLAEVALPRCDHTNTNGYRVAQAQTDKQSQGQQKKPCIYILNAEAVLLKIVVFECLTCSIYKAIAEYQLHLPKYDIC